MKILEETTKYVGSRFETGLLWRNVDVVLPESRLNALSRLKCLERKLDKNSECARAYCDKIQDYEAKGYIQKMSNLDATHMTPRTWYLPHFSVVNPNKPMRIRLVFDAAAKSNGVSLNTNVLTGPDLLNPLPAVLWKFRQQKIAFSADIKVMFHQVNIREDDLPSQRFLWRGMDRDREPDTYVVKVMTFGSTSSLTLAAYVKNRTAEMFKDEFPEAAEAIIKRIYVDDYADSKEGLEESTQLVASVIDVLGRGGFVICNWVSNSPQLMATIPEGLRGGVRKEIRESEKTVDRILGMHWDTETDVPTFKVNFHKVKDEILSGQKTPTKREVLCVVMSVFDPLGSIAHYTVMGKMLLQEIWKSGLGWDDELRNELNRKWLDWISQMGKINQVEVPRCYSTLIPDANSVQLHIFCDASEEAFCAVAYLRVEKEGRIETGFVMARTRVAPIKSMSVPRLELQASVMGSRMAETIKNGHEIKIDSSHFWTDSKTVLWWLRSENKRYHQFVAHRIGEILEKAEVNEWHWVPTKLNVADEGTRWNSECHFEMDCRWFQGPDFLKKPNEDWPQELDKTSEEGVAENREERKVILAAITYCQKDYPVPDPNRFSTWIRLIRATARVLRAVKIFKSKVNKTNESFPPELTAQELDGAELLWWKKSQHDSFPQEIMTLKNDQELNKKSRLFQLSPMLDKNGILKMNGRIKNCPDGDDWMNNPVILDPSQRYTQLLISRVHEQFAHQGKEAVLNHLRQKYWILRMRPAVKKAFHTCQQCKNSKVKPKTPEMGQLPRARLTPGSRPFTFTGMDYFGPLEVSIGRKREKRYGVLFTCMTVRAVHLEVAASLTTDSAIMAIRRFIGRRGCPKEIYSDNGTNLRGADRILRESLMEFDRSKLMSECTNKGIDWKFNLPSAPHMGGIWERMVQSVKKALKTTLYETAPKEEVLHTLFVEAENIVNSRPLTVVSVDPQDPESLTPNHLLMGSFGAALPPGEFDERDLILREMWRQSQKLADNFWRRWIKEYRPTLTRRSKWHGQVKEVKVGDVVIVVDDRLPRNHWPKGVITAAIKGKDGHVRVVDIRTTAGTYRRPVAKICVLDVRSEDNEPMVSSYGGENVNDGQNRSQQTPNAMTVSDSPTSRSTERQKIPPDSRQGRERNRRRRAPVPM